MSKGGYRTGAGRKKGSKDSKPRKMTEAQAEADKIRQMLILGTKAKAKFYQEFIIRVSKGDKLSLAEKKMMDQISVELAAELGGDTGPGVSEGLEPLTYMLRVMNDPKEDPAVRRQMATAAAPYCHPRKGESGTGKKDEQNDRAASAARGKFSAGRAPLALVK
jgi:hypothetical protein